MNSPNRKPQFVQMLVRKSSMLLMLRNKHGLVYYSEGGSDEPVLDLMNLNNILEKIIEAMKMRAVTHHGASVEVAKK